MIADGIERIASLYSPKRMPSNQEVLEAEGNYALSMAIQKSGGYKYWANKLGLEQKYSETALGIEGERTIAGYLESQGFEVKPTSVKHPYDLLINGCIKVDVKTAKTSYIQGCPIHAYRLGKKDHTCDFYIFYEWDTLKTYVVPAYKCQGQVQVEMGKNPRPYGKYFGAYDLIQKASDMYRQM